MRHRLVLVLVAWLLGCGGAPKGVSLAASSDAAREREACRRDAPKNAEPEVEYKVKFPGEELEGQPVTRIDFRGFRRLRIEDLKKLLRVHVGDALAIDRVAETVRALSALAEVEHVQVDARPDAGGVAVSFTVTERPRVGRVFAPGVPDKDREEMAAHLGLRPGDVLVMADFYERRLAMADAFSKRGAKLDFVVHPHGEDEVDVCLLVDLGR